MMKFSSEQKQYLADGVALFNDEKFWECHELLEDIWMESNDDSKYIFWALIQVSAAMVHYREENFKGCSSLFKKCLDKIRMCEASGVEEPDLIKLTNWGEFKALAFACENAKELSDFTSLYKFKFREVK